MTSENRTDQPRIQPRLLTVGGTPHTHNADLLNSVHDIICFTPDTLIETPKGAVPIETLKTGDLVSTADNGAQELVWIGSKRISGARLQAVPRLRPIKISAGSLGDNLPASDLWVSPQHCMLSGTGKHLISAKNLLNTSGIATDTARTSVTYIHLLFEHHQIIFANRSPSESFLPSAATLRGLTDSARTEVLSLLPNLAADEDRYGPPARALHTTPVIALASSQITAPTAAQDAMRHIQ